MSGVDQLLQAQLSDMIRRMGIVLDFFEAVRKGGSTQTVWNGSQDLPTVAKAIADIRAQFSDMAQYPAAAKAQADRAELAATAASATGRVFASPDAGVSLEDGVADGEYFSVRSTVSDHYVDEYKNDGGVAVATGKNYPSAGFVLALRQSLDSVRGELFSSALEVYLGSASVPLHIDAGGRVLSHFDAANSVFRLRGVVGTPDLAAAQFVRCDVAGNIVPIIVDAHNRVLLGLDLGARTLVGWGASQRDASIPVRSAVRGYLTYGQSNSIGAMGRPLLSTVQHYGELAWTFIGGPRSYGEDDWGSLKHLVEDTEHGIGDFREGRGETPCSALIRGVIEAHARDGTPLSDVPVMFSSAPGRGSQSITNLSKGTEQYENLLNHLARAHGLFAQAGKSFAVPMITYVGNETNSLSRSGYTAALLKLQRDVERDHSTLIGEHSPLYFAVVPPSGEAAKADNVNVPLAILDAVMSSDRLLYCTPHYHLPKSGDGAHLSNYGHYAVGLYAARVGYMIERGQRPVLFRALAAYSQGTTLRVRYQAPRLPLRIDSTELPAFPNNGIRVVDANGTVPLSEVSIDNDTIVITLSRALVGAAVYRYALDYTISGPAMPRGAGGNLCDSTDEHWKAPDGVPLPSCAVAVHQSLHIVQLASLP